MKKLNLITQSALLMLFATVPALAQLSTVESETTEGTVVSVTNSTMVVETDEGAHILFVLDEDTERSNGLTEGAQVTVVSTPDSEGLQVASNVRVGEPGSQGPGSAADSPVPPEVRRMEAQIARQFRRFRAGVRAGVGLDPEVVTGGVHAKLGPFFARNLWFRPNAEFGIGEVTTLAALNFEAIYRLPITDRQSEYSIYMGAGPGLNFIDRNFEEAQQEDRDINFDDFDFEGSLNILAGVEFRSGMFLEMKTAVYSRPTVRFLVGYSF